MECTQRLECTQALYDTNTEKTCPEQIGFLGICGVKHPVLKGPNKIGRDPQTCSITLNLNSVSRQHAVINVLNSREYMLMDLDSANKTKLLNKILQPYIPHPLRDGDTVQFGDIFGVFRLLEDDNELPMTQAIDIPDTPVVMKHVSKLNKVPTTMIPESPDVSDRDDSFATPQNRSVKSRLSNSSFIHLNNKSSSTKQETSPKTYSSRKTSKLSNSLSFISNPNTSLNESLISLKADKNVVDDIHEMDTQAPNPTANESTDSIYTASTQVPPRVSSPSIHSLDTQVTTTEHLPQVRKIAEQHEMQIDIYAANKENNRDIFNAETQPFLRDEEVEDANTNNLRNKKISDTSHKSESKDKLNTSEEELLFDDVDGEIFDADFNSQNILQDDLPFKEELVKTKPEEINPASKRDKRIPSDGSTDCEDIDMLPTQKIPELPIEKNKQQKDPNCMKRTARVKSDSSTDCEDDDDIAPNQVMPIKKNNEKDEGKIDKNSNLNPSKRVNRIKSDSSTDCEDIDLILTQKIPEKKDAICDDKIIEINDAFSDKVDEDNMATQIIDLDNYVKEKVPFEDMATQIIDIDEVASKSKNVSFEDQPTQIINEIEVVPNNTDHVKKTVGETSSPFKVPSSIKLKNKDTPKVTPIDGNKNLQINADDNYYNATQEIFEDLCSQKDLDVKDDKSKEVGKNKNVAHLKRIPSDSSDETSTPKKTKPFIFTDGDLPDSQEIKKNMMSHTRADVTDSSSESEVENNSEEQFTPVVHHKKKRSIQKLDLTKMLELDNLPERVLTRQRKPTYKMESNKKLSSNILKPAYLIEQEDQIDGDIIKENIQRLKTYEKAKSNKDSKVEETVKNEKKPSTSRKKNETRSSEPKEKIKVKIEKPKKKETKSKSESSKDRKTNEAEKNQSTEETTRTLRTRSKKVDTVDTNTKHKPVQENNKKEPVNKRNSSTKKQEKERSKSPEIEVRRSKRQRNLKENPEDSQKGPKSILKKSLHEQSTVYNISSSSSESPKSLKRSLVVSDAPSPKRTRGANTSSNSSVTKSDSTSVSNISNASLRATPARLMKTQHVLFTAFPSAEVKEKLEKLGAVIVSDVMECSVVLTVSIKRTFKLLCAVGLGRPIVGPSWVQACVDTHIVVDPWLHLIKDESAEKRFQFSLQKTLSSKRNFLKGYNVSSTPSVQPNASEMKLIVECSGGTWKEGGSPWVCVSCPKDKAMWPALRKRGATVVSTEFILGGVLRQKIDLENNTFT